MALIDPGDPNVRTPAFAPAPTPAKPAPAPKAQAATNPWLTDPGYLAATTAEQQHSNQIDQQTQDALSRLLIQYGDSGIAGKAGLGNIDPAVSAEAAANTQAGNSILAQLQHAHELNQRGIINQLAAHGLLFSGDTGYRTSEENRQFGNNLNDAQNQFIQAAMQANSAAVDQKDSLHQQVIGALENAYNNYVTNPAYYGQAQTAAPRAAAPKAAPWAAALHARSAGLNQKYGL